MSVLFFDPVCPKPYNSDTLRHEPLGGTEATVVRVSEGLVKSGMTGVVVWQHNGQDSTHFTGAPPVLGVQNVVCLRVVPPLKALKQRYPNAKLYLWLHDLAGNDLIEHADILREINPTIVVVSEFHKTNVIDKLKAAGLERITIKRIYNPIDDDLQPDGTQYDPNKLVFFSSPHKGLPYALDLFQMLRRIDPAFSLYVANPGYLPDLEQPHAGVVKLGPLSHSAALEHVRSSLAVFYPNTVFPETFGLVFAEANAVGTPCITASIGAAREVTYHPSETMDVRDYKRVVDRVLAWKSGNRPVVKANPDFRLSVVADKWRRLLTSR